MKLLLDTNAYSGLLSGHPDVVARVRSAETVLVSAIVTGELLFGFRNGHRMEHNTSLLRSFLENPRVRLLQVGLATAERFGLLSAQLRKKGRPIPTNDVWIAAHAMENDAALLSSDHHFAVIDELAWISF